MKFSLDRQRLIKWLRWLQWLLYLLAIVGLVSILVRNFDQVTQSLSQLTLLPFLLATVLGLISNLLGFGVWRLVSTNQGLSQTMQEAFWIHASTNMLKYAPGLGWQQVGRGIQSSNGIRNRPAWISVAQEYGLIVLSGGVFTGVMLLGDTTDGIRVSETMLLPEWSIGMLGLISMILIGALWMVGKPRLESTHNPGNRYGWNYLVSIMFSLFGWVSISIAQFLCFDALQIRVDDLTGFMGRFSLATLTGLLIVFFPQGIGIREGIFVGMLSMTSVSQVILGSLLFRMALALSDICYLLIGWAIRVTNTKGLSG